MAQIPPIHIDETGTKLLLDMSRTMRDWGSIEQRQNRLCLSNEDDQGRRFILFVKGEKAYPLCIYCKMPLTNTQWKHKCIDGQCRRLEDLMISDRALWSDWMGYWSNWNQALLNSEPLIESEIQMKILNLKK